MNTAENQLQGILSLIKKHFPVLFGVDARVIYQEFRTQHFGNWIVVLQTDGFRVRIYRDRSEVFLSVGPVWAHPGWQGGPWYDIEVAVAYITQYSNFIGKYKGELKVTEPQISRLSEIFGQYYDQIQALFVETEFTKHSQELQPAYNRVVQRYMQGLG